ncbi:pre-mRNA-splicing factor 8 [Fusarium falciforme]|nr:pre-mRNA-splicing factor 8 [Fusarium falciforme]
MSGIPPPPPGFEEDSDLALPPPPPPPPGYEIEELDNPMVPSSVNEDASFRLHHLLQATSK